MILALVVGFVPSIMVIAVGGLWILACWLWASAQRLLVTVWVTNADGGNRDLITHSQ